VDGRMHRSGSITGRRGVAAAVRSRQRQAQSARCDPRCDTHYGNARCGNARRWGRSTRGFTGEWQRKRPATRRPAQQRLLQRRRGCKVVAGVGGAGQRGGAHGPHNTAHRRSQEQPRRGAGLRSEEATRALVVIYREERLWPAAAAIAQQHASAVDDAQERTRAAWWRRRRWLAPHRTSAASAMLARAVGVRRCVRTGC
jgi:hypothetical protein